MKKMMSLTLFLLLICSTAFGYQGDLPKEQFALGGIPLYADVDYVKSVYGEPDRIDYHAGTPNSGDVPGYFYYYGTSFLVFISASDGKVYSLVTTANNGIATPAGIHVGSTVSELFAAYNKRPSFTNSKQLGGKSYSFSIGASYDLVFYIDGKDKVTRIICSSPG